jgi:hypothetical protein
MNVGIETEFYVLRPLPEGGHETLADLRYQGVCPAYDVHQTVQSLEFLAPTTGAQEPTRQASTGAPVDRRRARERSDGEHGMPCPHAADSGLAARSDLYAVSSDQ